MTKEEEVRDFAARHIPDADKYLAEQSVPLFGGLTWEQAFAGNVSEYRMNKCLARLRELFGGREVWSGGY